jgi:hypothetical protein
MALRFRYAKARLPVHNALYRKALVAVATACWHHRASAASVLEQLWNRADQEGIRLRPELVTGWAGEAGARARQAEDSQVVDVRTQLHIEWVTLRDMYKTMLKNMQMSPTEAIKELRPKFAPDVVHSAAWKLGLTDAANKFLPASVWELRTRPRRMAVFSQTVC